MIRDLKNCAINYKGKKCQLCGYDKCVRALHFHHIDSSLKKFNISSQNSNWTKIQIELDKCILVCSNCHSEIHSNLISKETIELKHQVWIDSKVLKIRNKNEYIYYK